MSCPKKVQTQSAQTRNRIFRYFPSIYRTSCESCKLRSARPRFCASSKFSCSTHTCVAQENDWYCDARFAFMKTFSKTAHLWKSAHFKDYCIFFLLSSFEINTLLDVDTFYLKRMVTVIWDNVLLTNALVAKTLLFRQLNVSPPIWTRNRSKTIAFMI